MTEVKRQSVVHQPVPDDSAARADLVLVDVSSGNFYGLSGTALGDLGRPLDGVASWPRAESWLRNAREDFTPHDGTTRCFMTT
jgi:hypothetical protein